MVFTQSLSRMAPDRPTLVLLLISLLSPLACSQYSVDSSSSFERIDRTVYPALAICPPQFFMEHRPYQVFQYTYDLLEVLSQEGMIPVIAPWEYDPSGSLAVEGVPERVLSQLCDRSTVSITDIALLDFRIEEIYSSRSVAAPASMGGGTQHQAQAKVSITLSVRPFPRGQSYAHVRVDFEDDPYTYEQIPEDPRPILREGIKVAGRRLARLFRESYLEPPPGSIPELSLIFNPIAMFTYEGGAGTPLESDFENMDYIDRLAGRLVYYQYFHPRITTNTLTFFEQSEPGLLVDGLPQTDTEFPLEIGDYIVRANGHPIFGLQSLHREFLLTPEGGSVRVTVLRDGRVLELELPVPPSD